MAKAFANKLDEGARVLRKGGDGGGSDVFERFGSEAEAAATTKAGGLVPRPGHERQPKWIAEVGTVDPGNLGKPGNYTHKMTLTAQPGTREWLKQFEIKANEPGRYAIPASRVDDFNARLLRIVAEKK